MGDIDPPRNPCRCRVRADRNAGIHGAVARAIWSGTISFGLVSVPVRMYAATESKELRFHFLTKSDLQPIGYDKVRKDTVYAPEPARLGLLDRLRKSKSASRDAWLEGQAPVNPTQFIPLRPIESVLS